VKAAAALGTRGGEDTERWRCRWGCHEVGCSLASRGKNRWKRL